jgi:GxxExxY protein
MIFASLRLRGEISIFAASRLRGENYETMNKTGYEKLSKQIMDSAYHVHREMGPGLLESVYQYCLADELRSRKISVEEQVCVPLFYKGKELKKDFRIDILAASEILIELKAVEVLLPIHEAQIISYLKLADKRLGFLINFNVPLIKNGFRRFVNNY